LVAARRTRLLRCIMPGKAADRFLSRTRDKNPLGCGRPHCRLCHGDKVDGKAPALDERRDLSDID
jgi:hypothetical protein